MLSQWKVSHLFSDGVDVQNPITAYKNMALTLYYDGNKLLRIEHELDCDDTLEPGQVVSTSQERLKLFWELLRYRRGISLPEISTVAQKVQPANGSPPKSTGFSHISVDALICSPITMPDPRVFSDARDRLFMCLRLANDASDSSDAVYAIRNYYTIWEVLYPSWKVQDGPTEAKELKLSRDFVSHGNKLNNPDLLDLIKRKLGKPIRQFDPTDKAQQQFISLQCKSARNLIETELNKLL